MSSGEDAGRGAAEARARVLLDRQLVEAGWSVQDKKAMNLFAARGVCRPRRHAQARSRPRRLPALRRPARRRGMEAKPEGTPLSGVEWQPIGLTPLKGNKAFYEGGTIPWITSGDLHQGLLTEAKHFSTQTALDETTLRLVPTGAILIAMYPEGKTRDTAAELGIDATTNQACAAVVVHDPDLRQWVRLVLDANYSKLRRLAAGGVQPNLNQSMVKGIEIAIPVCRVRSELLAHRAEFDDARLRLQSQLATAQLRAARLRRSVLAAAFSGRLTGDRAAAGV